MRPIRQIFSPPPSPPPEVSKKSTNVTVSVMVYVFAFAMVIWLMRCADYALTGMGMEVGDEGGDGNGWDGFGL